MAGDNFFKNTPYNLEVVDAREDEDAKQRLRDVEEQLGTKRNELRKFETEYREVRRGREGKQSSRLGSVSDLGVALTDAQGVAGSNQPVVTRARHVRASIEEGDKAGSGPCVV